MVFWGDEGPYLEDYSGYMVKLMISWYIVVYKVAILLYFGRHPSQTECSILYTLEARDRLTMMDQSLYNEWELKYNQYCCLLSILINSSQDNLLDLYSSYFYSQKFRQKFLQFILPYPQRTTYKGTHPNDLLLHTQNRTLEAPSRG